MRLVPVASAVLASGWIAAACVGSDPELPGAGSGERGGPCDNGVCLAGLACVDKVCVLVDASAPSPIHDASASSEASSGHPGDASADAPSDASNDAPSDAGDGGACVNGGGVVISEILTRGVAGPNDEFVELYNLGPNVVLDSTWTLYFRGKSSASYSLRWTGTGKVLPTHRHYLIGGASFTPTTDGTLTSGVGDSGSVVLEKDGSPVDAVCYAASADAFEASFTCEGTPISVNPHDDTSGTNTDQSLERLPRGTGTSKGNCEDTGQNANDFGVSTENPQRLSEP